jgi:hypothetical protein
MVKNNLSIILDTNWYISYLIKSSDSRLTVILNDEHINIIASDKLIEELRNTVKSKKFRKYFSIAEANSLLNY